MSDTAAPADLNGGPPRNPAEQNQNQRERSRRRHEDEVSTSSTAGSSDSAFKGKTRERTRSSRQSRATVHPYRVPTMIVAIRYLAQVCAAEPALRGHLSTLRSLLTTCLRYPDDLEESGSESPDSETPEVDITSVGSVSSENLNGSPINANQNSPREQPHSPEDYNN